MLLGISEHLHIPLDEVPFIGDSTRDIEAARNAGAQPWLVRTGKGQQAEAELDSLEDVRVHDNLAMAVEALLEIRTDQAKASGVSK